MSFNETCKPSLNAHLLCRDFAAWILIFHSCKLKTKGGGEKKVLSRKEEVCDQKTFGKLRGLRKAPMF